MPYVASQQLSPFSSSTISISDSGVNHQEAIARLM
jgi:hypothetical protein